MPFVIPSLADLTDRARNAFRTEMPGSDAWLWPNNIAVTAKVLGGLMWELFGRLDQVQRQKFALTAEGEWLDRHGQEFGLARRPASLAAGAVTVTAAAAAAVAAGAVLQRADGVRFTVTAGGAIGGAGSFTVQVAAQAAGRAGLTRAGTPLAAVSGVTGAPTFAVSAEGLANGADEEDDETFRARILFRKRNPPAGGAPADYVMWATAVPGVTRVFVERTWAGPGTVRVFPLTDGLTAGGIPTAATVAAVQAAIAPLQPAGAAVTVAAPVAETIAVAIAGLNPDTAAVREAVLAEMRDAVLRLGKVAGSDTAVAGLPFLATAQTFSRSWLWQAVANATGEERHVLTVPSADVSIPAGRVPVLGTVTFV